MSWSDIFLKVLKDNDVRLVTYVPDNRLRRATRREDGEPGWRFKIGKPLLMSTGQIWQGRV